MPRLEKFVAIALVAFGLAIAYYAHQHLKLGILISPGAGFIPFGIGIILAVLGVAWFVAALLDARQPPTAAPKGADAGSEGAPAPQPSMLTRFLPGVLLILAYAWLFERAGYFASTLLFMVGWQKIVEREGWGKALLVAIVTAVAMYALFSFLLKGVLPSGSWIS